MLRDECVWKSGDLTIFLTPLLDWGWVFQSHTSAVYLRRAYCPTNLSEGSLVHRDWLYDVERRKSLLLPGIETGVSCSLGRGLVNNWVYLTEEPDFRGENRVSNATDFLLMLFSGAGGILVLGSCSEFDCETTVAERSTTPLWRVEGATERIHIR